MEKRKKEQKKKAKTTEIKEVKMSYKIETHDYGVRLRQMIKFIEEGDRVSATISFSQRLELLCLCRTPCGSRPEGCTWPVLNIPDDSGLLPDNFLCQVKVVIQFRGREQQHIDLGMELLQKCGEELGELATMEGTIRREGGRLLAMFKPKKP
jgi:translation initiation factor IF-3